MTDEMKEEELRREAMVTLKKKRDLLTHAVVYAVINGVVIVIWALTGHGFFWPMFVLLGWGVGLILNVWDVYFNRTPTRYEVDREVQRLRSSSR